MYSSNSIQPSAHLCLQLGFDELSRQQRLAQMGLDEQDTPILKQIQQDVIAPNSKQIMDRFYDYLFGFDGMRKFLGSEENIQRLKTTQREYLNQFGQDLDDLAYFEYRLRIGIAHERIGLPLHMYLAAFRYLQAQILDAIPDRVRQQADQYVSYVHCINKVVMLDCSLAIDAYSRTHVEFMSNSIQALAEERDLLHSELMHDTLTGIHSRRFILDTLNKQLAQLARQPERELSIAMLDLDNFKQINDNFGHLVGDKVIYEFCRVASNRLREQDYFGRFGGEEFLMILTDISPEKAYAVLNRIRAATQSQTFTYGNKHIPLTVSIGLAAARAGDKVDDLIERADGALYQAKLNGRNRVCSAR